MVSMMFGGWLVQQEARSDWVGLLAAAAAKDPLFPKTGDPEMVRKHLGSRGADPDQYEMLEDAEAEWLRVCQ